MAQLQLIVVTPESTVLDEQADFVALPLYDGEIGIAPGRAPLIGRLGYGELRVVVGGQTTRYYVDGGFVQVADNVVSVLTNRALPAASIDRAWRKSCSNRPAPAKPTATSRWPFATGWSVRPGHSCGCRKRLPLGPRVRQPGISHLPPGRQPMVV